MNIFNETNYIDVEIEGQKELLIYKIHRDGTLERDMTPKEIKNHLKEYDNFYVHSGAQECIIYYTIGKGGSILEVNRFNALHKNVGIKRNDGTRG